MKHNIKSRFYIILQLVFFLVVPVIFIWMQSGKIVQYKMSISAIVAFMIVFLIFKKTMINPRLEKISNKIAHIETNQLSTTDPIAIKSLKKKWRKLSLLQLFINIIIPIACLILFMMTIKVVEKGLIKLYAVLMLSVISMGIGTVCRIAEIYAVKLEHENNYEE